MMKRRFRGVWIPAKLYEAKELNWTQKLLLVEIDSFSKNNLDCFVSNEHLAVFLQISESGVEKALRYLVSNGWVTRNRRVLYGVNRRILRLTTSLDGGYEPHSGEGGNLTQVRHTNTSTNTTTKPTKERQPSTQGGCVEYFIEIGSNEEEAAKFFDWYEQTGWKLKGGTVIVDWKATARNWKRRTKEHTNEKRTKGFNKGNFDPNTLERFVTEG